MILNDGKRRKTQFRRDWQEWYKLFAKETLVGQDSAKNAMDAPDEWWEKKQLENPQYGKFRQKGLPFYIELTTLFKDMVDNGQAALVPPSGIPPNGIDENNDVHRLFFESGGIDMEEGYGDTEELEGALAGVGAYFQDINFSTSRGNDSDMCSGKR